MNKNLNILSAVLVSSFASCSLVSCKDKLDSDVAKKLSYTDSEGKSNLKATADFKNDKFIYQITGYDSIKSKVSSDDISDEKIKSFVTRTLSVDKKEDFKDITEEFINVVFSEIKVESNKIKFSKGTAEVQFKKADAKLKSFKDIQVKDFEMEKTDIEKLFNKITEQDFKYSDLKEKSIDSQTDFKSDSSAGKALKSFATTIKKTLNLKVTTQDATAGTTLKISLDGLNAEKTITVPPSQN